MINAKPLAVTKLADCLLSRYEDNATNELINTCWRVVKKKLSPFAIKLSACL